MGSGVIGEGGGKETLIVVFVTSSPEELIRATFAAEVPSGKEEGTFIANVFKTNRTLSKTLHFI